DYVFFFFSSRRRHTRFSRDWSSDVCSSDLFDFLLKVLPEHLISFYLGKFVDSGRIISLVDIQNIGAGSAKDILINPEKQLMVQVGGIGFIVIVIEALFTELTLDLV